MIRAALIIMLMLLLPSAVLAAGGGTAMGTLQQYCLGHYDVDAGFCAGYVTAIADLIKEQQLYGVRTCNLEPVHSQQLMELVQLEMNEGQVPADQSAAELTAMTFARYYPCR